VAQWFGAVLVLALIVIATMGVIATFVIATVLVLALIVIATMGVLVHALAVAFFVLAAMPLAVMLAMRWTVLAMLTGTAATENKERDKKR
jgi:hypothetical protein